MVLWPPAHLKPELGPHRGVAGQGLPSLSQRSLNIHGQLLTGRLTAAQLRMNTHTCVHTHSGMHTHTYMHTRTHAHVTCPLVPLCIQIKCAHKVDPERGAMTARDFLSVHLSLRNPPSTPTPPTVPPAAQRPDASLTAACATAARPMAIAVLSALARSMVS